jgi:hypothetical protein
MQMLQVMIMSCPHVSIIKGTTTRAGSTTSQKQWQQKEKERHDQSQKKKKQ